MLLYVTLRYITLYYVALATATNTITTPRSTSISIRNTSCLVPHAHDKEHPFTTIHSFCTVPLSYRINQSNIVYNSMEMDMDMDMNMNMNMNMNMDHSKTKTTKTTTTTTELLLMLILLSIIVELL